MHTVVLLILAGEVWVEARCLADGAMWIVMVISLMVHGCR